MFDLERIAHQMTMILLKDSPIEAVEKAKVEYGLALVLGLGIEFHPNGRGFSLSGNGSLYSTNYAIFSYLEDFYGGNPLFKFFKMSSIYIGSFYRQFASYKEYSLEFRIKCFNNGFINSRNNSLYSNWKA